MTRFEIIDAADQQFSAILNNRRVTIRLRWNAFVTRWMFDLAIDDVPVINGRRVVSGLDLLAPFKLGIGVIFAAPVTGGTQPDRQALPKGTVRLYHATQAEIAAAS